MIRVVLIIGVILGTFCFAQDRPLGDVARDTRAHAAQTKPSKVLTDEDEQGRPIGADDDPLDIVAKAATAMLHDTSHRCREQSDGNSGAGSLIKQTEVGGVDRIRLTGEHDNVPNETVIIGQNAYRKVGRGTWVRLEDPELSLYQHMLDSIKLPDELKFGYKSGDLKLVGPETLGGSPTYHYRFEGRDAALDRTIDIWVGAKDYLPRRAEMVTHDLAVKIDWRQTIECTYGLNITIEPPL